MKLLDVKGWQGFLGTLIAAPISILVGLFYILPFVIFKQYKFKQRYGWILEFQVIKDTWADKKLWNGWAGMSIANFIVYAHYYSDKARTEMHERRHSSQVFTYGFVQPIVYISHVLFIYFFQKDKHPYLDCIWERDAREFAGQLVDIPRNKWFWGPNNRWPWF